MKIFIFLIVILLIIPLSFAGTFYNETGLDFKDYRSRGINKFNTQIDANSVNLNSFSRSLSEGRQHALVSDLNNDGIKEIIVLDQGDIRLFANRTLSIVDSINIGGDERYSNIMAFDIDGDSFNELIIVTEQEGRLDIINFTGTLQVQQSLNLSVLTSFNGVGSGEATASETMITCGDINECLLVYTDTIRIPAIGVPTSNNVFVAFFNSSFVGNEASVRETGSSLSSYCLPKIRHIQHADYDVPADGSIEYIFSFIEPDVTNGDSGDDIHINYVRIVNNIPINELNATITDTDEVISSTPGTGTSCINPDSTDLVMSNALTSPLVADSGDGLSNGLETWIAAMINPVEFALYKIDSGDTTHDKRFPDTVDADGVIISNIFRANAFSISGEREFCVMGHQNNPSDEINILCASDISSFGGNDDLQFFSSFGTSTIPHNISQDYYNQNILVHSVSSSQEDEGDNDEVLSSYGVLDLDNTNTLCGTFLFNDCTLDLLFTNVKGDAAIIPVDYEDIGREDFILVQTGAVTYLDDQFTNTNGFISEYSINPCIDSTWKINTSVTVTITVKDNDTDEVAAESFLYLGDSNEISFTTANTTQPNKFTFNFIANKSIGTGTLRMVGKDTFNFDNKDILDKSFSVGFNGLEFGDCITTEILDAPVTAAQAAATAAEQAGFTETNLADNGVRNAIVTLSGITGLGSSLIWLIIMIAIALGIWFSPVVEMMPSVAFGVLAIVEFLMIMAGVFLGIFSLGVIIAIVVIGIVLIGLWVGTTFTGLRANGR